MPGLSQSEIQRHIISRDLLRRQWRWSPPVLIGCCARTIAVLGGGWAQAVILTSLEMQFDGKIWPVHPRHQTVAGLKAYRDIDDLPAPPDAVFVRVNRFATIEIVEHNTAGAGCCGLCVRLCRGR